MAKETRLCNTPLFDTLMEVLSHYQCPSDCQSICCKYINIDMDGKDFKILSKASKTKIENVKLIRSTDSNSFYHSINPTCPFLSNVNKCSAYNRRPTVCKMYPFYFDFDTKINSDFSQASFNLDSENIIVKIYPCKLAIIILNDYIIFSKEKMGFNHSSEILNNLVKANENLEIAMKNDSYSPLAGIKLNSFVLFNEYHLTMHQK